MNISENLRVINIGLPLFYKSLKKQKAQAAKIDWRVTEPEADTINTGCNIEYLHICRQDPELIMKIKRANQKAVHCIIDSDPVWVDICPAGDVVEGLDDYTVIHSGPPIDYQNMVMLHQRGLISACLFEGWVGNETEAIRLIQSGKLKLLSALDTNTVGAGTGIVTRSVAMIVTEDRKTGKRAATFPAEGPFQGGFCGWGLYSEEIAENLRYMKDELFPILKQVPYQFGPVALKTILAESMQMGDENHTRQTAADLLFQRQILPKLMKLKLPWEKILPVIDYITDTPRFFHCFGQGAARSAMLSAVGTDYSTMVTAVCGNGAEFGIKIAALGNEWFTAEAPMMNGRYTSSKYTMKDQLPWMGDSCVVECAGMGGLAAAASPIVCALQGMKLRDAIAQTREMKKICISSNHNFSIPNMDFEFLPVGIDMLKVLETGIAPRIHGGMFNYEGGLIGAGSADVPMECFNKAMKKYIQKYGAGE